MTEKKKRAFIPMKFKGIIFIALLASKMLPYYQGFASNSDTGLNQKMSLLERQEHIP
jgi:hypothetical protein